MMKMASRLVCVNDYEQEACRRLDRNAWGYYSSGADDQQSLKDNVDAFTRYILGRKQSVMSVNKLHHDCVLKHTIVDRFDY